MLLTMSSIERTTKRAAAFLKGTTIGSGIIFLLAILLSFYVIFSSSEMADRIYGYDGYGALLMGAFYASSLILCASLALLGICAIILAACRFKRQKH